MTREFFRRPSFAGACAAFLAVILVPGCVTSERYDRVAAELAQANSILENMRSAQADLDKENASLRDELIAARAEGTEASAIAREAALQKKAFEEELEKLRAALRSGIQNSSDPSLSGVELLRGIDGSSGVRIAGSLLFDLGKTELSQEGKNLLVNLASQVRSRGLALKVVGHTDTTRFAKPETIAAYPFGNLQLSVMRAIVVADQLIKAGGISPDRISVAGYGEYKPIESNATDAGKARNRRVEIFFVEKTEGGS
ncbi:MAG: OmpA family protein [Planctomycetes bacterium]|nr:OmpA family protein [Planctomycetota bacterium]